MIKKYGQFVNENQVDSTKSESETDDKMVCIQISQDEENLFGSESILQNLVSSGRITYKSGELCYPSDDEDVVDIVKSYFKGSITESMNEVRHNQFDEEEENEPYSDRISFDTNNYTINRKKLAQDAFEAGMDYNEGESDQDFDTWWSNYKK